MRHVSYKITDPAYYSRKPTRFLVRLRRSRPAHITSLRDKSNPRLQKLAKRFKTVPISTLKVLHADFFLARRLGFGAVHLAGSQLHLARRARSRGMVVLYSAHTPRDLKEARRQRVHLLTYSPVFHSPGKGEPIGLRALRRATRRHKNIIALGGITSRKEIRRVLRAGALGYASIRGFF